MARLQGALDNDIHMIVQKLIADGVSPDLNSLYSAIQKSNSSLKRKPKKLLQGSLERVLDFIGVGGSDSDDSEAALEAIQAREELDADSMNRSLRANLVPSTAPTPSTPGEDRPKKRRQANGEPLQKRQKSETSTMEPPRGVSWDDIGGMDGVIRQLGRNIILPLLRPEIYRRMNARLPTGILLHGPPGCGKTMLARACAAEVGLPFVEILGPSIVSGMSGESEKGVREKFDEAKKNGPCLLFIDEIDAIAPKRDSSQSQMEKRIVAQLLVSMDELGSDYEKPVIILAATNRPDSVDPALRRGGRFDTEINIGVPSQLVREQILRAQTRRTPLSEDVDFRTLARMTAGFVGSDLHDLVGKAVAWRIDRFQDTLVREAANNLDQFNPNVEICIDKEATPSSEAVVSMRKLIAQARKEDERDTFIESNITMSDFLAVLPEIVPSGKREGFATVPDVSWKDIGALQSVREELQMAIVEPIKNPERYASVGINTPTGVLLWGPPGCGKTLLAKAAAAESKANFISVKGPELLSKFVGDSEAAVRRVFTRARSSVPCVIFFDEVDALVPRREDSSNEASARVVNTLLSELDGLSERTGIYVIGATNRPEIIDDAMLRPGRLETPLFVDLPGPQERFDILVKLLHDKPIEPGDAGMILAVGRDCDGYSGADLGALVREAGHCAIRRNSRLMQVQDFKLAASKIRGSVGDMRRYYKLMQRFGQRK